VMAATSRANSAKMEYNLAASENRDAMAPPKTSTGIAIQLHRHAGVDPLHATARAKCAEF
jgi:hypothetical protein